jgi:hypothetical protein
LSTTKRFLVEPQKAPPKPVVAAPPPSAAPAVTQVEPTERLRGIHPGTVQFFAVGVVVVVVGLLAMANWPKAPQSGVFTITSNTEAYDSTGATSATFTDSITDCEQSCRSWSACKIYTYSRTGKSCYQYAAAKLRPNPAFDAGVRK